MLTFGITTRKESMAATTSSTNFTHQHLIQEFNGEDYDFWSVKVRIIFRSLNQWKIVEKGYEEPSSDIVIQVILSSQSLNKIIWKCSFSNSKISHKIHISKNNKIQFSKRSLGYYKLEKKLFYNFNHLLVI